MKLSPCLLAQEHSEGIALRRLRIRRTETLTDDTDRAAHPSNECEPKVTERAKILAHSIGYAETRIAAQTATMDAFDSKAFALLAVDISVAAVVVSVRQDGLGRHWWVALIAVGVATAVGLFSLKGLFNGPQVGDNPEPLGTDFDSEDAYLEQLSARLLTAVAKNESDIIGLRTRLAFGFIAFMLMAGVTILIALVWK